MLFHILFGSNNNEYGVPLKLCYSDDFISEVKFNIIVK